MIETAVTTTTNRARPPRLYRGLVPRLDTPRPMGPELPALFQDDSFAQRLTGAFDDMLAPVFSTLDNFEAYLDAWLSPEDFLDWLGAWVGLELDEALSLERRRQFVARAHELFRVRGTLAGLRSHLETFTGAKVEIEDTGGVKTSTTADSALPGSPNFALQVRVIVDHPEAIDRGRLETLVAASKPAHVTHKVEIVKRADVSEQVEVTTA